MSESTPFVFNQFDPVSVANAAKFGLIQRVPFQFWAQPVYQQNDGTYLCPGFVGNTYADSPWDKVYIGLPTTGTPYTPGVARVTVKKYRDVDKKKAAGNDGARVTIHGIEPASIEIQLDIWTAEQLRQLYNLWGTLFPPAFKGTPPAYDVQHPVFTMHSIKSVQFVEAEGPTIDPRTRMGHFVMRAIEFIKPKAQTGKATAVGALPTLYDNNAAGNSPASYPSPGSNSANTGP